FSGGRAGCSNRIWVRNVGLCLLTVLLAACSTNAPAAETPVPSATAITPTIAPSARPTATAMARPTATAQPIFTPLPSATTVPTRAPDEAFWADLQKYPAEIASTVGPQNDVYTAYLISDITFCHLYFFRWDGYQNTLVEKFSRGSWCE